MLNWICDESSPENFLKNKLSLLRRQKGIKQYSLAKSLNVSPSYLCKIEKGILDPDEGFINHCADFFEVNKDFIFSSGSDLKETIVSEDRANNNLWQVRTDKKLKQNRLAELMGCSPSYLSRVEKGIQKPNGEFKKKCARVLKVKQTVLFPTDKTV